MSSILTYVPSFGDVRALLGVSEEELEDVVLGLRIYELGLLADLARIDAGLIAAFDTASSTAVFSQTAEDKALIAAVQTFATYQVAEAVSRALSHIAPKTITDGKAMTQRQAGDLASAIRAELRLGKSSALAAVKSAYAASTSGASAVLESIVVFLAAKPASDPVLGT